MNGNRLCFTNELKQQYIKQYQENLSYIDSIKELSEQWKFVQCKGNIISHIREIGEHKYYCRGQGLFNASLQTLKSFFIEDKFSKITNPGEIERYTISEVAPCILAKYVETKIPLFNNRYSLIVGGLEQRKDCNNEQQQIISIVSIDIPDFNLNKKKKNGLVCMKLSQSWYLREIKENLTEVILVSHFDPQGNFPNFLLKQLTAKRGLEQLLIVQKYCFQQLDNQQQIVDNS